jgi:fermentation-respiration switch protein FrsA (DUF1100 family)
MVVGMFLAALGVVVAARLAYPRLLYPAPQRDEFAPGEGRLLKLTAADGVPVHAIQLDGPKDAPVLVYFHGNGVVMGGMLWMARELVQRGIGVVLVEYRGYGLSAAGAAPSEAGLYQDAEAVLTALAGVGIGPERIALLGESLGTGVAVEMAARRRGTSLVLLTPYTSITDAASRFAFGLPVRLLMSERFDSPSKAARVAIPTLVVHGTRDSIVPYAMGAKLAKALAHARLITVEGGGHNDLFLGDRWPLFDEIANFVRLPN